MTKEGYTNITLDENTLHKLKTAQKVGQYKTIPETIRGLLSKRSTEYKIKLLMRLVNSEINPFAYLLLESNASEEQENAIYKLMDKTEKKIRAKKKLSHHDFEKEVYYIFPNHYGDYHLAEGIVGTLGESGRWKLVYEYFKKNGMNLR